MSFTTLAVLNNLFLIAELPLPISATAPSTNTLNTQLIEVKVTTNYSRDLITLAKIYTEESKYSKKDNNFNYKLMIFNNLYNKVNILTYSTGDPSTRMTRPLQTLPKFTKFAP